MVFRITWLISTLALVNSLDTNWLLCPSGSFIKGINVGVDPVKKVLTQVDFSCVPLETQVTDNTFQESKQLPFKNADGGALTGREYCQRGLAIGTVTRKDSSSGLLTDVTLICANRTGIYPTESKGLDNGSPHTFTCASDIPKCDTCGVCGVQAVLKPGTTTLANLNFKCCGLPNPADECTPKDDWSQFLERDNRKATDSLKSYYSYNTGVQMIEVTSETTSVLAEIASTVGFRLDDQAVTTLRLKFGTKDANIKHTWSITDMSTFSTPVKTAASIELNIPAKYDVALQQLVGKCGPYVIWANTIKRVDDDTSGSSIPSCAVTMFHLLAIILVVNKII